MCFRCVREGGRAGTNLPVDSVAVTADGRRLDSCAVCGSDGLARVELREMLFGTRERFEYWHCLVCDTLRIGEVPTDLGRHYPSEYFAVGGEPLGPRHLTGLAQLADEAHAGAILFGRDGLGRRLRNRLLRRWRPPPLPEVRREADFARRAGLRSFDDPILDVGCGKTPGRLVRLRRIGFRRLMGVDPWLDGDGTYLDIPVRRQSIHEVEGVWQAITFNHSFEHVPDPSDVLRAAAARLAANGTIVIRTPIMGGWFWRTYGRDWWELDPPRHLFVHSREGLERLAADAGLIVADVVYDSSFVEIVASEQIRRNIAWREAESWFRHPPAGFDERTLDGYRATVQQLNEAGDAGRAALYLRRSGSSPRRQ